MNAGAIALGHRFIQEAKEGQTPWLHPVSKRMETMSARIAPESIGAVAPVAEYRQPAPTPNATSITRPPPAPSSSDTGLDRSASSARPEKSDAERRSAPVPPMPPLEQPGADYVRAVISGALAPRPTSAQELFARVGTSWTPPESEYRLTEKIA